jgi:hypothetical protein
MVYDINKPGRYVRVSTVSFDSLEKTQKSFTRISHEVVFEVARKPASGSLS